MATTPNTPSNDTEALHDSIHAEYRQALADAQWGLANANARVRVQAGIIAELTGLLGTATNPGHADADQGE